MELNSFQTRNHLYDLGIANGLAENLIKAVGLKVGLVNSEMNVLFVKKDF